MKQIGCPVCGSKMDISTAQSRRSRRPKTFLMLTCSFKRGHFRGFINDEVFVSRALQRAGMNGSSGTGTGTGRG